MLKVSIRAGGPDMVMAQGDLKEILADLSITIKGIRAQMKNVDHVVAEIFKRALKLGVTQEDGPVWGGTPVSFVGVGFSVPGPGKDGG